MSVPRYIKLTIRKDFGAVGVVELEIQSTKAVDDSEGMVEVDAMTTSINAYFDHIINEHLPKMRGVPLLKDGILTVAAMSMYVKMDKRNKPYIAVKCGEWQEFGLPFYPENFKPQGISIEAVLSAGEGGHIFKDGTTCEVMVEGGKAKKVVKIIGKQTPN